MNYLFKCAFTIIGFFPAFQCASANESPSSNVAPPKAAVQNNSLDVSVTNAIVYVPLGRNTTTNGFFTISNRSGKNVTIVGVMSSWAKQIKLMPKAGWVIDAHESLTLKPEGYYLQINDLKNRLTTGDELHLTLSLSNGQKLQIIAVAKSAYDQIHGY